MKFYVLGGVIKEGDAYSYRVRPHCRIPRKAKKKMKRDCAAKGFKVIISKRNL